jgi:hypothetical protein
MVGGETSQATGEALAAALGGLWPCGLAGALERLLDRWEGRR